jgi:hypothetical protein
MLFCGVPGPVPWQVPRAMRLLACSLLVVSSSAYASTIDPPAPRDGATLKGRVLVWHDATLYAEPSDQARSLQLATLDGPRKDRVGHVVALRVVSTKGAFVEVELAGDEDCTASRVVVPDDLARVRMFVRRADVAPVLVKPFARAFDDGTAIRAEVGTPLVPTEDGAFVLSLRGTPLAVDVPADSVGHAYAPRKSAVLLGGGHTVAIAARTTATLGGRSITLGAWTGAPIERREATAVVSLEHRCVAAQVIVASKALAAVDESVIEVESDGGSSSSLLNFRDDHLLPRLTPLSIGTRQVAVAAKHIYLHAAPNGKQACIQRALRIESSTLPVHRTDDRLRLCAPASRVAREVTRRL